MAFADLPIEEQRDQVTDALQALLGDNSSKMDYVLLCRAARDIVEVLEEPILARPLPGWAGARAARAVWRA